jgi:uncharacterized Zn-binding protein involved in type VI secretion
MKFAARVSDAHQCPMSVPVAHVGGVIAGPGVPSVKIGHLVAATQDTTCACGLGARNRVAKGSSSVQIGGKPAARAGDPTTHGGSILVGCSSVVIG